jgi:hypothetical protein
VDQVKYFVRVLQRGSYPYPIDRFAWTKFTKSQAEKIGREITSFGGRVQLVKLY